MDGRVGQDGSGGNSLVSVMTGGELIDDDVGTQEGGCNAGEIAGVVVIVICC